MEELKKELMSKGATMADWCELLTNGLQPEDQLWVESKNWRGRVMEYP